MKYFSVTFARTFQMKVCAILGFSLFDVPNQNVNGSQLKIKPYKSGIFISIMNFILACFGIYLELFTKSIHKFDSNKTHVKKALGYRGHVLALFPLIYIVSFWILSRKFKVVIEILMQGRYRLKQLGIDVEKASSIYLVQIYGTFLVFIVYMLVRFFIFFWAKTSLYGNGNEITISAGINYFFNFYKFASIYNLVATMAFVGLRMDTIQQKLNEIGDVSDLTEEVLFDYIE